MKKRLFLLLCGVMCLFLVLCSCGDEDGDDTHSSHSHPQSTGSSVSTDSSVNTGSSNIPGNNNSGDITTPESKCKMNEAGHYWSEVSINKNTSAQTTVALTGKCHLCKENLYKICASVVDYEEFKNAISPETFSSFTMISGAEYTDFDKNSSMSWREKDNVYTVDYFINSTTKNSGEYAKNFQGFKFDNFTYNSTTKTYMYWFDVNSYIELGFADGYLIYHSVGSKNGDTEQKTTTLYLNHQRITVEKPEFVEQKFNEAVTLEKLQASSLGVTMGEKLYGELSQLNFDLRFEASLLENDRLSVYFYLNSTRTDPVSSVEYSAASIIIQDTKIISITLGTTTYEVK